MVYNQTEELIHNTLQLLFVFINFKFSFQDVNMSPADSSGDSSDGEVQDVDQESLAVNTSSFKGTSAAFNQQHTTSTSDSGSKNTNNSNNAPPSSTTKTQTTASVSQPPVLSPLLYQTPQGMMYATPSNGGVIFSLAPQAESNAVHPPQFITIPLSVVAANGQGELDLSKRK